jgi:hypothetical protein
MPPSDDRTLERVRKLLAHAEHPNTPPAEAEAMSEKAAALMARHAIDAAMLDAQQPQHAVPEQRTIAVPAPYAMPKAVLLSQVGAAYRVRTVIGGGAARSGRVCTLVGFRTDLEVTELLFTSLLLQATAAMLIAPRRPGVRAFRHAFLLGYAASIGQRLTAAAQRTADEATASDETSTGRSTELVLLDRRQAVDRAFAAQFPHLRTLRPTVSDGSGMAAGHRAGAAADLGAGHRRVGAGRRSLEAS